MHLIQLNNLTIFTPGLFLHFKKISLSLNKHFFQIHTLQGESTAYGTNLHDYSSLKLSLLLTCIFLLQDTNSHIKSSSTDIYTKYSPHLYTEEGRTSTTYLPYHVWEEAEVETGTNACQDNEGQSQVSSNFCRPDGIEGVPQLHSPFAHIEDEETKTPSKDSAQVTPVDTNAVPLNVILRKQQMIMNYLNFSIKRVSNLKIFVSFFHHHQINNL